MHRCILATWFSPPTHPSNHQVFADASQLSVPFPHALQALHLPPGEPSRLPAEVAQSSLDVIAKTWHAMSVSQSYSLSQIQVRG